MPEEFVMRGQTASGETEILEFGGHTPGYAYRLTEFQIYAGEAIGTRTYELAASVTAAKTAEDPSNPNFNNEGLIAVANLNQERGPYYNVGGSSIVNDTFLITQNLIIAVIDNEAGSPGPVNWQCRFKKYKLSSSAEAVANFKQFTIFDG